MSRRRLLEVFKFSLYVSVPIALTYFVVYKPENLQAVIENRAYVRYPPEAQRPPSYEELKEIVRKKREEKGSK